MSFMDKLRKKKEEWEERSFQRQKMGLEAKERRLRAKSKRDEELSRLRAKVAKYSPKRSSSKKAAPHQVSDFFKNAAIVSGNMFGSTEMGSGRKKKGKRRDDFGFDFGGF